MFHDIHPCSPVEQEFIWVAEYDDGTHISEYNFYDKKENAFSDINKAKVVRFGLIGLGQRYYFEVFGGVFKVAGRMYELVYKSKDGREIPLTGRQMQYDDLITYKDAEMMINHQTLEVISESMITKYTFGYKATLQTGKETLQFKALCTIPFDQPMYFKFRLVSDKKLDGELLIRRNNTIVDRVPAPLKRNQGGEVNWIIQ